VSGTPERVAGADRPPAGDFTAGEIEGRWERARALMAEARIDALMLTSEPNYRYLSGHATQAFAIKARPLLMLLPIRGRPALVVAGSEAHGARRDSPVEDVFAFSGLVEPGLAELEAAIHARGLERSVIGCELGAGHRLGLSVNDFWRLQRRLPDARFVNAGQLLWRLRAVKSPAEIAWLRRAAAITDSAVAATLAEIREGWSERDVHRAVATKVMAAGADRPGYIPVNADSGAPDSTTGGPTDRLMQPDRTVYLGAGCVLRGYWSDLVRCFAIGEASDHKRQVYRAVSRARRRCFEVLRPGVTSEAVMRASLAVLEDEGLLAHVNTKGRIGHGTGLDLGEPPSLQLGETTPLEAGMVLYVEPSCLTAEGNFMVEEMVLLGPDGPELLSTPAPDELPVIAD
jgi:Xaa-Pro dipeptidase